MSWLYAGLPPNSRDGSWTAVATCRPPCVTLTACYVLCSSSTRCQSQCLAFCALAANYSTLRLRCTCKIADLQASLDWLAFITNKLTKRRAEIQMRRLDLHDGCSAANSCAPDALRLPPRVPVLHALRGLARCVVCSAQRLHAAVHTCTHAVICSLVCSWSCQLARTSLTALRTVVRGQASRYAILPAHLQYARLLRQSMGLIMICKQRVHRCRPHG